MSAKSKRERQAEDDLLDWFTVSYRTIYLGLVSVVLLAGAGGYYYYTRSGPPPAPTPEPALEAAAGARFSLIEGSVKVKPVGTFEWVSADRSMVLRKSDLVKTGASSSAEITFFDNTVVHIRPDSLITIEETSEDPSTRQRRVSTFISSGEVNFQTARRNVPGSTTEVSMPNLKGTVGENSSANIRVVEGGDSDVRVLGGSVKGETRSGQRIDLGSSEAIRIDPGGKAGEKFTLLAAPALLAPPHMAEISYPDPTRATTLLAWKSVPGATSYHVMVDYSPYFNRPLVDRRGHTDASVELRGLDVGKYYWRVAAADKDQNEGIFSDFQRFTVTRPSGNSSGTGPPPPLVIESLDLRTNILQVKGKTEPGASVTINGQRVDVQGDGSFNEFITLAIAGRQLVTIRSTGINGGINVQKRPVVVAY
jgi:FecR protein